MFFQFIIHDLKHLQDTQFCYACVPFFFPSYLLSAHLLFLPFSLLCTPLKALFNILWYPRGDFFYQYTWDGPVDDKNFLMRNLIFLHLTSFSWAFLELNLMNFSTLKHGSIYFPDVPFLWTDSIKSMKFTFGQQKIHFECFEFFMFPSFVCLPRKVSSDIHFLCAFFPLIIERKIISSLCLCFFFMQ